jgi:hypothetical protein
MNLSINNRQIALLLAGLLAAAPACAATAEDVQSVDATADELKATSVYTSKAYSIETNDLDVATNKTVKKVVQAKLRVTVAKAGKKGRDYQFDGRGEMAHEFKVEWVDAKGQVINWDGDTYYAKATGKKGEFRLFYCQSTNNCGSDSAQATVSVSADDKTMVINAVRVNAADPLNLDAVFFSSALGRSVTLNK